MGRAGDGKLNSHLEWPKLNFEHSASFQNLDQTVDLVIVLDY